MTQNWPTRYRCKKCTRTTSSYPFGCPDSECPIKRDMGNDLYWTFTVGLPILIGIMGVIALVLIAANK